MAALVVPLHGARAVKERRDHHTFKLHRSNGSGRDASWVIGVPGRLAEELGLTNQRFVFALGDNGTLTYTPVGALGDPKP